MVRRCLLIELDAGLERPETRRFSITHLLAHVRTQRSRYLEAIYTLLRSFILAAESGAGDARLAGFDDWTERVLAPVLYLGFPDPLISQQRLQAADEENAESLEVLEAWYRALGEQWISAGRVRAMAERPGSPELERLRDALHVACELAPKRIGKLLTRIEGRPIQGLKVLGRMDRSLNQKVWSITKA